MKLFLDTNIFIEFIEHRKQYEPVSQIIDAIIEEQHTACISTGCLYTLAYLFERGLKLQDIHKPELTLRIRHLLAEVLNMSTIVPLAHANAETAVYDESFTDIEDSFQYRCALENRCHVLITINDNDLLLNLYGDMENHKGFPDIGEPIKKKIICSKRRIDNNQILFDMKKTKQKSTRQRQRNITPTTSIAAT